jgi:DNA-binding NtrC family response regulator
VEAACVRLPTNGSDLFDKPMPFSMFRDIVDKKYLERQLERNFFSVSKTAPDLQFQTSNLSRKLKELGISLKQKH